MERARSTDMYRVLLHRMTTHSIDDKTCKEEDHDSGTESDVEKHENASTYTQTNESYTGSTNNRTTGYKEASQSSTNFKERCKRKSTVNCGLNAKPPEKSPPQSPSYLKRVMDNPADSSASVGYDSSDEELCLINCCAEKRKRSQLNRWNSCEDERIESSDEEEEETSDHRQQPLNFISSPPKDVLLSQTLPPLLFLAKYTASRIHQRRSRSQRKRYRHANAKDVTDISGIQRPYLDFEKMQILYNIYRGYQITSYKRRLELMTTWIS